MTFTTKVKNEISESKLNELENRNLLLGYIFVNANFNVDKLVISLENLNVASKLFKTLKYCYNADVKMTIRMQKKFVMKKMYIFEITDKKSLFKDEINNLNIDDTESIGAFIKGVFLGIGSINDPQKSRYHLELLFNNEEKSLFVLKILNELNYNFKLIKRDKGYMLYLKASEEISDFLKLLGAVNSLFYFEDIRIYRDHANMVNRLNNCEQANYEKSLKASDKQTEIIKYLKNNDYVTLLDEKTRLVCDYRLKYPEVSYQVLADIMSQEINKNVTKSFINHHLRKINEVYERILKTEKDRNE